VSASTNSLQKRSISRRGFLKLSAIGCLSISKFTDRIDKILERQQFGRVLLPVINVYQQPSFNAKITATYPFDSIINIDNLTHSQEGTLYNKIWYVNESEGYIHSSHIQPVLYSPNSVVIDLPENGSLAEVTVPFSDTFRGPDIKFASSYRLYYSSTHWVTNSVQGGDGTLWYRILDDRWNYSYYARAADLRIIPAAELRPINPQISQKDKKLVVKLAEQIVIAYEKGIPVFMSYASTGGNLRNGKSATPLGSHTIYYKRPHRHMFGSPDDYEGYDFPGVPWVSYITRFGIAFHGVYWHNNFGGQRSHGCINLPPNSAKWIYCWSQPYVPHYENEWFEDNGTSVVIIE